MDNNKTGMELKKHTASIHCSNALSLLQRKISNAFLYHAYPFLLKQEEHVISIHALCQLIGYNGNDDKTVKEAIKKLISTVMEWNVIDDTTGEEDWTASAILASVNIKKGICTYAYSPRLRELFYNPLRYGKINLLVQAKFSSNYGLALYENCIRYKGLEQTKIFSIQAFRKLMGVPDDKYAIFRDFKRRVLDKAVEEVNAHSDIVITPKINRAGRKVISIQFRIKSREKKKKLGKTADAVVGDSGAEVTPAEVCEIIDKMVTEFQFPQKIARTLIEKYGAEKVRVKMKQVQDSAIFKNGKINSLPGFLTKAIEENYLPALSSQEIIRIKNEDILKKEKQNKAKEREKEQLKKKYHAYADHFIVDLFSRIKIKEKENILNQVEESLRSTRNHVLLKSFKKERGETPRARALIKDFLLKNQVDLMKNLLSYEEYFKK